MSNRGKSMSLADWADALASGEVELNKKAVKKGHDSSYGHLLVSEWHPVKNGDVTPDDITYSNLNAYWWKHNDPSCVDPGGHEYEATTANRSKGSGCPACAGKVAIPGLNDLATTHPEIAADWHPTANGEITPYNVKSLSNRKVWWKHNDPACVVPGGFEWESFISMRTDRGTGCPACNQGWRIDAVRQFVITMIESGHIGSLTQAELYTLMQQNGMLRSLRVGEAVASLASGKAINDFADSVDSDDPMAAAMADPEAVADLVLDGLSDDDFADDGTDDAGTADLAAVVNGDATSDDASTDELPGKAVERALTAASTLFATVDEAMLDYFVAARLHVLWEQAYKDPEAAREAAEAFRG